MHLNGRYHRGAFCTWVINALCSSSLMWVCLCHTYSVSMALFWGSIEFYVWERIHPLISPSHIQCHSNYYNYYLHSYTHTVSLSPHDSLTFSHPFPSLHSFVLSLSFPLFLWAILSPHSCWTSRFMQHCCVYSVIRATDGRFKVRWCFNRYSSAWLTRE